MPPAPTGIYPYIIRGLETRQHKPTHDTADLRPSKVLRPTRSVLTQFAASGSCSFSGRQKHSARCTRFRAQSRAVCVYLPHRRPPTLRRGSAWRPRTRGAQGTSPQPPASATRGGGARTRTWHGYKITHMLHLSPLAPIQHPPQCADGNAPTPRQCPLPLSTTTLADGAPS